MTNDEEISSLLTELTSSSSTQVDSASLKLGEFLLANDLSLFGPSTIDNLLKASSHSSVHAKVGAYAAFDSLANLIKSPIEPLLMPLIPALILSFADKNKNVQKYALKAASSIVNLVSPMCIDLVLPYLFQGMDSDRKWQSQVGSINLLVQLIPRCSTAISIRLAVIVPVVRDAICNIRTEVQEAATNCMLKLCAVIGNPDVEKVLPNVVMCMGDPLKIPDAVEKVSETTFVKAVGAPLLSVMMPLLGRGLGERANIVKRRCAIDNMCRLVSNPLDIIQFLDQVVPALNRIVDIGGDPEMVSVTARALITLNRVSGIPVPDHLIEAANFDASKPKISSLAHSTTKRDLEKMEALTTRLDAIKQRKEKRETELEQLVSEMKTDDTASVPIPTVSSADILNLMIEKISSDKSYNLSDPFISTTLDYVSKIIEILIKNDVFDLDRWEDEYVIPYLEGIFNMNQLAESICRHVYHRCQDIMGKNNNDSDSDIDGEYVANCEFSLGYGAMVLLRKARMKLKPGHRYGICGANGCGKSTLLKAIAKGQVDGFPSQDKVRTFMVADELQASDADTKIIDLMANDPKLSKHSREKIADTLTSVGFTTSTQNDLIGSLSGGWKMKLALARGILMEAHLLLLDEPTNHLDVENVQWLVDYLCSLDTVTSLIISHDTKFLDNVCTDIIHYETKKLKTYKGNLSEFVKVKPEAKAYYTLESANYKFVFPRPGLLDGVNSREKPVLRLKNVEYTYPNSDKKALKGVTAGVCLSSRIAIIGANGAGKSTLIKVLTGEMMSQTGDVWKHPTLRVTYVAQHPLKYLNMHLDKTPNEYVQWRFEKGEDKELLMKQSRVLSKEEEDQMNKEVTGKNGIKRRIESVVGRAKLKKSFQYEIKWVGMAEKHNSWIPRERLEEWGFSKILQNFDDRMAGKEANQGANIKELTSNRIQQHFEDFGLEPQFSTHGKIQGLSGGQKIKTILASAMWSNPHMIILDEPTNYLDRESLAALAEAIKEFEGGVVIISHNHDFTSALCTENWYMNAGELTIGGKTAAKDVVEDEVSEEALEETDLEGNSMLEDGHDIEASTNGPIGGGRVTSEKGKKLTRKQIKEQEYKEKRAELVRLGIVPE